MVSRELWFLWVIVLLFNEGVDGQTYTVTIVSNPAGTPVSGSANTFDYPILSSVTLTCNVTSSDGSVFAVGSFEWNTTGCYTNPGHNGGSPTCFPTGEMVETVSDNNVTAEDAGTITCNASINGIDYTSDQFTLQISGIAITNFTTGADFSTASVLADYSFVTEVGAGNLIAHCVTGMGPTGSNNNNALGGWYFDGTQIPNGACNSLVVQPRGAPISNSIGVLDLQQCQAFTTDAEGVYSCMITNSLGMMLTMRLGVYFGERTAPTIDSPSSSTVTVVVGDSLTLSCTSQGSPPDTFTWRKDIGPIVQSTSITTVTHTNSSAVFRAIYFINSVTRSDSGTYTCTVTNPIGSASQMFNVIGIGATVNIISNPAGTPVSGSINKFDYPIFSSVTLTCMVDPSPSTPVTYQWDTTCFTNDIHDTPTCFPTGQTTQNVTGNNLLAEDAGTISCTVIIGGNDYTTSRPLTLQISGIAMTGASDISTDLVSSNQITDYSFVTQPFTFDRFGAIMRCATGLGPFRSNSNTVLGGWYFSGGQVLIRQGCTGPVFEVRGANGRNYPGVINIYLCRTFTTTEEGIYSCIMMNSSMMEQTMRVGVYFSGRTAPIIDPPSSSTVTVVVGDSLTLSCTSQGSPPDIFTWRKDSGPIVQSTSITTMTHTDSRAVFRAIYFINSVTISDRGTYTCTVTNPIGSDSEIISVNVLPPTVTISPSGPIQGAMVGSPQMIQCTVSAVSEVESSSVMISWMGPGGDTITNDSRVTINPTTSSGNTYTSSIQFTYLMEEDEGTYMCNVTILETSISASVVLEILTIPTPSVTVTAPSTQIVGQSLTLECSVTAVRCITNRVDIIWSRDSGEVLTRANDTSSNIMDSSLMYTDTYTISQLNTTDDGREYQCEVVINANQVITATDSVTLDVMVPPPNITLYQPVPHPDTGSGHNISCSVIIPTGVNPSLVRIDWIKDSTTVANSSRVSVIDSYDGSVLTKTVIFQQLLAADNGTYRCNVTVNRFTDPRTDVIIVNASLVNRNGNTELSGTIIGGIISSVLVVVLLLVLLSVYTGIRCYQKSYKKNHAVQRIDMFEIQPSTIYSMRKETPDSISDTSIDNAENDYSDWRRETPIEEDTITRRNETLHKINSETLSQNNINVN
ncbi:hemicentin-1-like isoform X2 [Dysidea avara]|uniref:hemicentin-1-like isoform X2 n=1 Tax=Dysidea avara TaxID=196820 RepID=UPI0033219523